MDKYTAAQPPPCEKCLAVDRIGDRLAAMSRAYSEALDDCAAALTPSVIAYDMCREALVSYVYHTDGKGHPGGLGALVPMLRHATDRRRLLRISRDVVRASKTFDDGFDECAREFVALVGGRYDGWQRVLADYLAVTDGEGHPGGLSAWLDEACAVTGADHERRRHDRTNAPGGAA